jgi:hypothetical protein
VDNKERLTVFQKTILQIAAVIESLDFDTDDMDIDEARKIVQEIQTRTMPLLLVHNDDERRAAQMQMLLTVVKDGIAAAGFSVPASVAEPAMPKAFAAISNDRGAQVAVDLLAADMILSALSVEVSEFIETKMQASIERAVATGEGSPAKMVDIARVNLLKASDRLSIAGYEESGVAPMIELAYAWIKQCRAKVAWRVPKELVAIVKDEVAIYMQAGSLTHFIDRLNFLLRLIDEVKTNTAVLFPTPQ